MISVGTSAIVYLKRSSDFCVCALCAKSECLLFWKKIKWSVERGWMDGVVSGSVEIGYDNNVVLILIGSRWSI